MTIRYPIVLAVAALWGCTGRAPQMDPTVNVTRAFYVELWVFGEENLAALYRANNRGDIGFGGGSAARNDTITWTGTMTPEDLEQLRTLVQEHGWCTKKIESVPEPKGRINRIQLWYEGHYRRMTVRGASPDVEPLRLFLDQAARQRLQRVEQQLVPVPNQPGYNGP